MKWPIVQITEVARIVGGSTPKSGTPEYWDGEIPWVTPKDISDLKGEKLLSSAPRTITKKGLASCSAEVLPEGSVIFSSRAPIGLVAINTFPVATNQGFKSFVPDQSKLYSSYLLHWLRANRPKLEQMGVGATFKELSKAAVARIQLPLPPLEEQKRIAALLDKAEEVIAKRRAAIALLDQLPQSLFLEMFGDPVTNPKGWEKGQKLGEVASLVSGVTKGRKVGDKGVREIPYLAVLNVQDKHLNLDTIKTIKATEEEIARYRLLQGDLLLTEGGDPDKLGRGTLWNCELPEAIHQNHVFRVRLTSEKVTPPFLSWLIGSPYGKSYFLKQAKQTTGIATINMGQLKAFPLILPPPQLQREFAIHLEMVHRAMVAHQSILAESESLSASLQAEVFGAGPSNRG